MLSLRLITLFAVALAGLSLAKDERLPHKVTVNMSGYMYCVATVLSKTRLLIPAMCASNGGSNIDVKDRSGDVPINDSGSIYQIDRIVFHPERNYSNPANEYAILTVDRPIDAGKGFKGAKLAKDDVEIPEGAIGTSIRRAPYTSSSPSVTYSWTALEYQGIRVINDAKCKEMFSSRWTDDYICAEPDTTDIYNPYNVESGASLVIDGKSVGIAACDMGCYGDTYAFRRLSTLSKFIAQ